MITKSKKEKRIMRHRRVRTRILGTASRPRLSVFRSNLHLWAQLIDDSVAKTIVSASDFEIKTKGKKGKEKKVTLGEKVGELIAQKAQEKKISRAVFDRGGYKYHGIVKSVAEGARKGGLKF